MPIHSKEALGAAASEIIREWGLGRYSQKKRYRDRRRHAALLGGNPVFTSPETKATPMYVYVIGSDGGPVKIGIAKDVAKRLAGIQTGHPEKLSVFFHIEATDARAVERECHRRLADRRLNGEWFDCGAPQAAELVKQVLAA